MSSRTISTDAAERDCNALDRVTHEPMTTVAAARCSCCCCSWVTYFPAELIDTSETQFDGYFRTHTRGIHKCAFRCKPAADIDTCCCWSSSNTYHPMCSFLTYRPICVQNKGKWNVGQSSSSVIHCTVVTRIGVTLRARRPGGF